MFDIYQRERERERERGRGREREREKKLYELGAIFCIKHINFQHKQTVSTLLPMIGHKTQRRVFAN